MTELGFQEITKLILMEEINPQNRQKYTDPENQLSHINPEQCNPRNSLIA